MKILNLSKNLTHAEMVATNTGLANFSTDEEDWKMFVLAQFIFQPIRDRFGRIRVTSGYRSIPVNKVVGGKATSQHQLAEAMDIQPLDAKCVDVFKWIVSSLRYGQVILEWVGSKEWIHVSMVRADRPNQQAFTYNGSNYTPYDGSTQL